MKSGFFVLSFHRSQNVQTRTSGLKARIVISFCLNFAQIFCTKQHLLRLEHFAAQLQIQYRESSFYVSTSRWSHLKAIWIQPLQIFYGYLPTLRGHIHNQSLPLRGCDHGDLGGLDLPGLQDDQVDQEVPQEEHQDGGHEGHGGLLLLQHLHYLQLLLPLFLPRPEINEMSNFAKLDVQRSFLEVNTGRRTYFGEIV